VTVDGVVLLNKPQGWTSRKAVNVVRRLFDKKIKAGHTGTLDPLATGMLPIMLGKATRFASLGLNADKQYRVSIDFSLQTDTLDLEGESTATYTAFPALTAIETTLATFIGAQDQMPPKFSAIRVNGKRAHALARQGEDFELATRPIVIHALHMMSYQAPLLTIDVRCSKGTYIRSLARDIGLALGVGGCVSTLHRSSTAGWPEAHMVSIESLEHDIDKHVLPTSQWLRDFPTLTLDESLGRRFLHGQRLAMPNIETGDYQVNYQEHLLGTAQWREGVLHPQHVLASSKDIFNA